MGATKKYLEKRIRGWLPKEPNLPRFPTATSRKNEHRHKIKLPIGTVMILSSFLLMSITQFFEGEAMGALFLWLSCVLGLSLALDILVSRGKELNEKFVAGLLLMAISLGGILANLYIFSVPTTFFARGFSFLVLVLVHVLLLFAVIAYVWGKKRLSKKLIGWFSSRS
jgi:peptidoglycan/LPS O-acetylase OafA/YrhL